jgi:hypothetical protein
MEPKRRSPWTWVGPGCAVLLVAAAVTFVAFLFVGQRVARSVRAQTNDPALRLARVQDLLRASDLPDGYAPALGLSVPLLGKVAILESPSASVGPTAELERRKFFFYLVRGKSDRSDMWGDAFDRLLDLRGLDFQPGETVAQGRFTAGLMALAFRTERALMQSRPRGEWPVLAALVEIDCPGVADTQQVGVWIEPDPAPDLAVEEVDLSGTPADPEAIRHFLSYFRLCDGTAIPSNGDLCSRGKPGPDLSPRGLLVGGSDSELSHSDHVQSRVRCGMRQFTV